MAFLEKITKNFIFEELVCEVDNFWVNLSPMIWKGAKATYATLERHWGRGRSFPLAPAGGDHGNAKNAILAWGVFHRHSPTYQEA